MFDGAENGLYTHLSRDQTDDIINLHLCSRATSGVSFIFVPYIETEISRRGGSSLSLPLILTRNRK